MKLQHLTFTFCLTILLSTAAAAREDVGAQWFFSPGSELHFDGLCSEADNESSFTVQSFAFFENRGADGELQALILAEVYLGGTLQDPEYSVGVDLENARISPVWPGARFSMQLELKNRDSGETVVSEARSSHGASFGITGEDTSEQDFVLPEAASFTWSQFPEGGVFWAHPLLIAVADIPDPAAVYATALILRNLESGERLVLAGPDLSGIGGDYGLEAPVRRELGFVETMTPGTKGGLFHTLRAARRYSKCFKALRGHREAFERLDF